MVFVQVAPSQGGSVSAPNGAVLGVTSIDEGQQGIKKPFLDHGLSREDVLLSKTGGIFTATYACFAPCMVSPTVACQTSPLCENTIEKMRSANGGTARPHHLAKSA